MVNMCVVSLLLLILHGNCIEENAFISCSEENTLINKPAHLWSEGEGNVRDASVLDCVAGLFVRSLLDSLDELLLLLS